jgi:phosphohistidine swiveling domain-containing protein
VRDLGLSESALYRATAQLQKTNLKGLSDSELYKIFETYYQIYIRLHAFHWLQTISDFADNVFSKYLMAYLKEKIKGSKYSLGDVFSVLTTPTKQAKPAEEYKNLLLILKYIVSRPKLKQYFNATETRLIATELPTRDKNLERLLAEHVAGYGWLGYGTVGPGWDKNYFIDILSSLIRQKADPNKLLATNEAKRSEIGRRQKTIETDLGFDRAHQKLFQFARDLVFTKGTRKDSMFHSFSVVENLFKEIGRRYYLSVRQVRFLQPQEFKALMIDHDFSTAVLNERYESSVYFSTGDYRQDTFLTGAKAKKFLGQLNIVREEITNVKIMYGDCASPGRERGTVKVVNEIKDMTKMNKGDILVSYATSPDLVPAIKKAAAIITDAGGITCHAAIISRELGIPCVVGTKIATKVLHDGDLIDVNATHGKINIIKKA